MLVSVWMCNPAVALVRPTILRSVRLHAQRGMCLTKLLVAVMGYNFPSLLRVNLLLTRGTVSLVALSGCYHTWGVLSDRSSRV